MDVYWTHPTLCNFCLFHLCSVIHFLGIKIPDSFYWIEEHFPHYLVLTSHWNLRKFFQVLCSWKQLPIKDNDTEHKEELRFRMSLNTVKPHEENATFNIPTSNILKWKFMLQKVLLYYWMINSRFILRNIDLSSSGARVRKHDTLEEMAVWVHIDHF